MNRIPVWMDCDTGTDDAVAIMLAHASPELEVLGISTAGGNTVQDLAYWNTQRLNGLLGTAYPVYRGAEKPLIRELKIATLFHGKLTPGSYAFSLSDMPKGMYIVRVTSAGYTMTQPANIR